jgi:hypothetical protein
VRSVEIYRLHQFRLLVLLVGAWNLIKNSLISEKELKKLI